MTDAAGYRENAELCAKFAERSRSPKDRAVWLLLSGAWLELARVREYAAAERASDRTTPFAGVRRALIAVGIENEALSDFDSDAAA
jgi:hypothetical protein